jgi:hypothetical protein
MDKLCEAAHHRLCNGQRVGGTRKSQRVGAACAHVWVASRVNAKFQLADCYDGNRNLAGERAERTRLLARYENRRVKQPSDHSSSIVCPS